MRTKMPSPAPAERPEWAADVATDIRDIKRANGRLFLFGLGGFVAWALLFPLGSAVIGNGQVVAEGNNSLVQHRTGGVISEILARNGDRVQKGDVLLRLDPVIDQAELGALKARKQVLEAVRSRLLSEQGVAIDITASISGTGLRGIDGQSLPVEAPVRAAVNSSPTIIDAQQDQFEQGRAALQSEINELIASRNALVSRIEGLDAQAASTEGELAIVRKQVKLMSGLVEGGHVARKTLWDLQQQQYGLESRAASVKAEAMASRDEAQAVDARIARLESTDAQDNARQLTDALGELAEINEKLTAADAVVASTVVRATASGTVVHNQFTTVGGVVPSGEPLAEIVPADAALLVKARIAPADISHVRKGQHARAKITSVNQRLFDDIEGEVDYVAADATLDRQTGEQYFEVAVRLTGLTESLKTELGITPGMQGQVFIEGRSRTFASYVLKPFKDSLDRAFQEK